MSGFNKVGLTVSSGTTLLELDEKLDRSPSVDFADTLSFESLVGRESKYSRHARRFSGVPILPDDVVWTCDVGTS